MIEFKELKTLIQKATVVDKTDISNMFSFTVDQEKLEDLLSKKTDLHVLNLGPIKSRRPTLDDYIPVSEYVYKKEAFDGIFNGETNIANFIIYCDMDGKAVLELSDEEKETGAFSRNTINFIMSELPIYRTLIIKRFNAREEKFDYLIYFRSNRVMINYIKALREEGEFENVTGNLEAVDNKEELSTEE